MLPYESIFATAQNAFFLSDNQGRVLAANQTAAELFGFSLAELDTLKRENVLDDTDPRLSGLLAERELNGKARGETTAIAPDGHRFPCEYSSVRFLTEQGDIHYCTELTDIRKWKQAEEQRRVSESHLQTIFDHTVEGFVLVDKELNILAYNDKAGALIFQHGEAGKLRTGISLLDYLPEERREPFRYVIAKVLLGEPFTYEQSYALPNGSMRWFQFTVSPVAEHGQVTSLCISGRDVTARVESEQQLLHSKQEAERSEEKYHKIFDLSPIPKWIYDLDSLRIIEVNHEALRNYGYTREEFLSITIRQLFPPEDQEALTATVASLRMNHQTRHGYWRHMKKNGEIIFVDITGHPIELSGYRARMVICQDVTARVQAEAALLRSNERFSYAVRATSDAIWDWDIASETVFLGEGFKTLFGYTEAGNTVPRKWIMDKMHLGDLERVNEKINAAVSGTEDRWADEYRFEKADGSFAVICNTALLIRDQSGHPLRLIGAMRDVTESREQLQAIQAQNQQLREIAWYQSHVVRAPLCRLLGLTELALTENSGTTVTAVLPLLKKTAEELDSIIRGIISKTDGS